MKKADLWLNVGLYYEPSYLQVIRNYFKNVGKNRACFLIDMKQILAKDLRRQRYKLEEIANILNVDHSNIVHYCNKRNPTEKYEEIKEKYVSWIYGNLVPLSRFDQLHNKPFDVKDGYFKLKKIKL